MNQTTRSKAVQNNEQTIVRCTIEHCSLFGLTTGLRILEISRPGSLLRSAFEEVLNDIDHTLVAIVDQYDTLPQIRANLQGQCDVDVVVLNHVLQTLSAEQRLLLLDALAAHLGPNGVVVISDFADVGADGDDILQAAGRYLSGCHSDLIDTERLSATADADGLVHAVAVIRPSSTMRRLQFASSDYTFRLRKKFGRSLDANRDFGVYAGKWNLIVGRSGSGKTSFLRALQGDMPSHTRGSRGFPRRSYFNMPQNVDVFDLLSPVQNVRAFGGNTEEACDAFEALGMEQDFIARRNAQNISGGERQRLLVAQILAADPELLILDEPSKGLDRAGRLLIFNALTSRFRNGAGAPRTVVCADHDFAAHYRMFDYVFEIGHGIQTLVWAKDADAAGDQVLARAATR